MENISIDLLNKLKQEKIMVHKWLLFTNAILLFVSNLPDLILSSNHSLLYSKVITILCTLIFFIPLKWIKNFFYDYNRYILVLIMSLSMFFMIYSIHQNHLSFKINFFLYLTLLLLNTLFFRGTTTLYLISLMPSLILSIFVYYSRTSISVFSAENLGIQLIIDIMMITVHQFHFKYYLLHNEHITLEKQQEKRTEQLSEDKNFLVKILCHDLGNSLTVMDVSTSIIDNYLASDTVSKEKITPNLLRIKRAIQEQFNIVNSAKQKLSLENDKDIKLELVDISTMIEKIQFTFRHRLKEKNLKLDVEIDPMANKVLAETISLSNNVLNNLLSNAIKFSNSEGTIKIRTYPTDAHINIEIIDTGVGMESEYLKNIFNENTKTTRLGTQGEKGTGFGLPLVKAFMKAYGGDITVESTPSKGSCFRLSFLKPKIS